MVENMGKGGNAGLPAFLPFPTMLFSSPEHKVLMVSFCDGPMSDMRRPQFL